MSVIVSRILTVLACVLAASGLVLVAGSLAFAHFDSPPASLKDPFPRIDGVSLEPELSPEGRQVVRFLVNRGESGRAVGARLLEAGLIRNLNFWNLAGRFRGGQIKAGEYLIEIPTGQGRLRDILETGRDILVRVTIPEGLTLRMTADLFEEAGIVPAEAFVRAASDRELLDLYGIPGTTMEGFLFPDTYLFPANFPAARVVKAMADNFFARAAALNPKLADMPAEELFSLVILASIVQKEYRVPEEAALMAGVFANRLRIGMALQSCATVVYVLTEELGRPHPNRIYYVDLEVRSPFNTYLRGGLPPAPIASPGRIALAAALEPAVNDFLFFRLINEATGRHQFSRTGIEHQRAGDLYRNW
ncbi:MAG: endolytic transglycosylase MltG [Treponema sp.]|nr:endolytic transglycosylase MltG [Treponema sp.]